MPAADLTEHPSNWRLHPPEQMSTLNAAIAEVGWAGALLYNERTGRLLDGHARRKIFAQRGAEVPVLIGDWDEETEKKILATLDPLGDMAETDTAMLEKLITEGDLAADKVVDASTAVKRLGGTTTSAPLLSLKPHGRNYKEHPPEQLDHLRRSIEEHGFYRPVVVARDNTILAGHGLWMAACGMVPAPSRIPVMRLPLDANSAMALKILAADNTIGELGVINDRDLTEILKEIVDEDDLLGTGFDAQQLAASVFVSRSRAEMPTMEAAAEWAQAGMPVHAPVKADVPRLTIFFDTREDRAAFVLAHHDVAVSARGYTMGVWSARWTKDKDTTKPAPQGVSLKLASETLPKKQREAFKLMEIDGKSLEETARILGERIDLVKGRVQRAWVTLKKKGLAQATYTRAPVAALRFDGDKK